MEGSDIIGSVIGAVGNYLTAQQTSDANQSINKKNITWQAQSLAESQRWQEYMRSTAYQATMADMKAAGLNPMLAFSRGPTSWGGASSSPGSSLGAVQPDIAGGLEHGVRALTTARSAPIAREQLQAAVETTRAQARQANATADNQETQARLAPALAEASIEASRGTAASGYGVAAHQHVQADNARGAGAGTSFWDPRFWGALLGRVPHTSAAEVAARHGVLPRPGQNPNLGWGFRQGGFEIPSTAPQR